MGGSDTIPLSCKGTMCAQPGWYGTRQVSSAANVPPGRSGELSWTDKTGNFWLFGGYGAQGYLGDLWKYSPATGKWVWIFGTTVSVDVFSGGPKGVYGSLGAPAPDNLPAPRAYPAGWVDSDGNLWLFGGLGYDANGDRGHLNDLWKFNPPTAEWTWVGGDSTLLYVWAGGGAPRPGIYGSLGVPASSNAQEGATEPSVGPSSRQRSQDRHSVWIGGRF